MRVVCRSIMEASHCPSAGIDSGVGADGVVLGTEVKASDVWDEYMRLLDRLVSLPRSIGVCGSFAGTAVVALALGGCALFDGDHVTVLGFAGAGGGLVAEVTGNGGPIISNADHHSQVLGGSVCLGATGTIVVGVSGEVCFSLNSDRRSLSGIWTFYGAASAGGGAEAHILYVETKELFNINIPCVGGWDLPNLPNLPDLPGRLPDLPDLWDLPRVPSLGCT
jgi:hypothetical protein